MKASVVGATLAVVYLGVSEFAHRALESANEELAHHVFHILFSVIALGGFLGYLVAIIRRDGWPTFSWRLDPDAVRASGDGRERHSRD